MAADGSIKIAIEIDGKPVKIVSTELDNLEKAGKRSGQGVKQAENSLKGVDRESKKAGLTVRKLATSLGLVAIGAKAFQILKSSVDAAINRFDTLNKFPRVLQSLGVSAEDSERSMKKLSDGIDGLPTLLNDIASTAQRMYTSFDDMDKATDSALALNNALLGSGASAADAQRGTEQYLKVLQTGKMELDTWNTLSETMDVALVKIAESFGFAGRSAKQDLYDALKDGHITIDQFNDKLIELGTGTGILAQLARENSLGIATSFANLRTAASRGLADIIESFNNLSQRVSKKDIAQHIDSLKVFINQAFKAIGKAIESSEPYVRAFASAVSAVLPVVKDLSPVLLGMASAFAIHSIINKTATALKASETVTKFATAAKRLYTLAILENTTGYLSNIVATKLSTLATKARTTIVNAATVAELLFTRQIKLAQIAMLAKAAAAKVLGTALRFLTGPVGWVTLAIGALVGAVVAVVKWFNRTSKEAEKLNKETEELGDSVEDLNEEVQNSSDAYKEQQKELRHTARNNEELARKIEELAAKENKSAGEKQMLARYIDQLNESVHDLNLTYDEEANALNMTSEQLNARLEVMKETEKQIAAEERLAEIMNEQNEIQMNLDEINALREEWNQKLEDGSVKSREHKKAIEELDEQEQALTETLNSLQEQQAETEEQITTSTENITKAIEEGNLRQITSYEDLEDAQKEAFDSMKEKYDELVEHATNAFEKMNTESEVTAEEMIENLEHNQKVTEQWAENVAKLYEWGGKEGHDGFLQWLETMGPESAAELQVVADMSDEELKKFAELLDEGGKVATESLKTSLGEGFDDAVDVMINFIDDGAQTLRQQIKSSGFDEIGKMVPEGLIEGIKDGTPDAEKASTELAENTADAFANEMGIQSPSKVFQGFGSDMTDGLVLGINKSLNKVINATKRVVNSSINQFKNFKTDFNSIGRNAMNGLNAGLNAGRGLVMATARSIANEVTRTMQNALKIQSPSKVMRDEIGRWIPAGLAEGIEKYKKLVDDATGKMIISTSPEVALGTSRMAYAGSMNQITNIYNNNTTNHSNGNQPIRVEAGDVYIDGYKAGKVLWRPVKENIDRDNDIKERFRR